MQALIATMSNRRAHNERLVEHLLIYDIKTQTDCVLLQLLTPLSVNSSDLITAASHNAQSMLSLDATYSEHTQQSSRRHAAVRLEAR